MLLWPIIVVPLIIFLLGNKRYRWIYILYKTLPRDCITAYRYIKLNWRITSFVKNKDTVPSVFSRLVDKHPEKVLFHFEDQTWSFSQLEEYSNQIAHYFKSKGYRKDDTIGLMLENRPEYVGIWLGLSKIGIITALINTNLVADPLIHSLTVIKCKAFIYGRDFSKVVGNISGFLNGLEIFEFGTIDKPLIAAAIDLSHEIPNQPTAKLPEVAGITPRDKLLYIFTSGTTGLPKAAVISHTRYMYAAVGIYSLADLSPEDTLYNPLPLYHTAGGMLAVGLGMIFGLSIALRRKFSASNYWSDCQKYQCNLSNYIGEICRYLLAVYKPGTYVEHPVKKMIGNGLRPQMWEIFVNTFHVEGVYEFYGSTEGNTNIINIDNTVGAVGFVPRYASLVIPVILLKCDEDSGEPIRDDDGFCIRCVPNEPGILVGKIDQKHARTEFAGYVDKQATEKKLLRNVFKPNDLYFNTGDVLVQDEFGYFYFKDRTGDTFRWKGENVATSEVEAVISGVAELKDAVVYGVQIPGTEGRAGMAAVVDSDKTLDLHKLAKGLKARLPSYAIPMFMRITDEVPMTGTFKMMKLDLQKEGYNYGRIKDRLYFFDTKNGEYLQLNKELYEDIMGGRLRL
ncbi:long-chain fatty acid transport protein 4-like isoform X1 [Euwallacea similis]|uniref:long-chain fatty acid transport protein 4-like isoform X1 n=1 Tax=Euwallacea similis TaxID=1736056 RepID=UPI00344ECD99